MKKEVVVIIVVVALILIISGVYIFYNQSQTMSDGNNLEKDGGVIENLNIEIKNFAFTPNTLTIKVGETVTWTNMDSIQHTVTSDEGNELDSELLSEGNAYSHTFNTAGTYKYHCTLHPFMKGEIIVTE